MVFKQKQRSIQIIGDVDDFPRSRSRETEATSLTAEEESVQASLSAFSRTPAIRDDNNECAGEGNKILRIVGIEHQSFNTGLGNSIQPHNVPWRYNRYNPDATQSPERCILWFGGTPRSDRPKRVRRTFKPNKDVSEQSQEIHLPIEQVRIPIHSRFSQRKQRSHKEDKNLDTQRRWIPNGAGKDILRKGAKPADEFSASSENDQSFYSQTSWQTISKQYPSKHEKSNAPLENKEKSWRGKAERTSSPLTSIQLHPRSAFPRTGQLSLRRAENCNLFEKETEIEIEYSEFRTKLGRGGVGCQIRGAGGVLVEWD